MLKGSKKWTTLGVSCALGISLAMYLSLPSSEKLNDITIEGSEAEYSRTLYGVPSLEMEHYRVNEDKYLKFILSNRFSVGKANPSAYPLWYSTYMTKMIAENNEEFIVFLQTNEDKRKIIYDAIAKGESEETYTTLNAIFEEFKKEKNDKDEELVTDKESNKSSDTVDTESTTAKSLLSDLKGDVVEFKSTISKSYSEETWTTKKDIMDKNLTNISNKLTLNSQELIKSNSDEIIKSFTTVISDFKSLLNKQDSVYKDGKDTAYTKEVDAIIEEITTLEGKVK